MRSLSARALRENDKDLHPGVLPRAPCEHKKNIFCDSFECVRMCNRKRVTDKMVAEALARGLVLRPDPPALHAPPPFRDVAPTKTSWVLTKAAERAVKIEEMHWGIPLNVRDRSGKPGRKFVTNIRNLNSPFWRDLVADRQSRCLVLVSEFCEWSGPAGSKRDYWFRVVGEEMFAFAGLWRASPDVGNAYAFLTCEPNPLVRRYHERAMPVILHADDYWTWLDGNADEVRALQQPFPSQLMEVSPGPETQPLLL